MSHYTYVGNFVNPTADWLVKETANGVGVFQRHERAEDGTCAADTLIREFTGEDAQDEAAEFVDGRHEFFEEDYDDYLEENRFEINRVERYEMWRNEY